MKASQGTNKFKKDLKKIKKQKKNIDKLKKVIELLCQGKPLEPKYRDHQLRQASSKQESVILNLIGY